MKRALLLVDVQNDFLPGGALAIPNGNEILAPIHRMMMLPFDEIIATQDMHPEHHCSFASSWGKKIGEHVTIAGVDQVLWPDHCVRGTVGSQLASAIDKTKITHTIYKGEDPHIDSYSAFADNNGLHETALTSLLRVAGIQEIYIAGLATNYCVLYSVLDALKRGFQVTVIIDGCCGIENTPGVVDEAYEHMKRKGAKCMSLIEVLNDWSSKK